MIRALYTAASGMAAQQANIDTVANNLANVNTAGFKKSRMEFEDLVYQQITVPGSERSTSADVAPVGLEIGLGTRPIATARDFSTRQSQGRPTDRSISVCRAPGSSRSRCRAGKPVTREPAPST